MKKAKIKAGMTNFPRVCSRSETATKDLLKNFPKKMEPNKKTVALTIKYTTLRTSTVPVLAKLATTAKTMIPKTSSITAAPTII